MIFPLVRRSLGACAALVALGSPPAWAQQGPLAEALFREARAAMKANDLALACPKFEESYRLDPSLGTLINLALCEEQRGHLATARVHFQAFLDTAPAKDVRIPGARQHVATLASRTPTLLLRWQTPPREGHIQLDGIPLIDSTIGQLIPIDPGTHEIVAHDGERERRLQVSLREGQHLEQEISLPAATPRPIENLVIVPPPVMAPRAAESQAPMPMLPAPRTAGWVLAGAGGTSWVLAAVAGVFANQQKSIVQAHCVDRKCDDAGLAAGKTGKRWLWTANLAFAVGLVEVGLGTWLVLRTEPQSTAIAVQRSFQ